MNFEQFPAKKRADTHLLFVALFSFLNSSQRFHVQTHVMREEKNQPEINPRSTLDQPKINPKSTLDQPEINPKSTLVQP